MTTKECAYRCMRVGMVAIGAQWHDLALYAIAGFLVADVYFAGYGSMDFNDVTRRVIRAVKAHFPVSSFLPEGQIFYSRE